jgi:hypothetical protein
MIDLTVSIVPLIVLSIANFFLSWVWYSPLLFAKPWMAALGIPPDHVMTETEKRRMPVLFASGVLSSFLMVYVMMIIVHSINATSLFSGAIVGALIWAGFAITHSLNTLWEGRKPIVLAINNGLFLLTYVGFGAILAVWK